jgi:translation initiation factor 4G
MFALLNQDSSEGAAPAAESSEPTPQRKRLVLAPRSKPLPGTGEDGEDVEEGEDAEEGDEEEETGAGEEEKDKEPEMSKEQAEAKIKANLDEFWNIRVRLSFLL